MGYPSWRSYACLGVRSFPLLSRFFVLHLIYIFSKKVIKLNNRRRGIPDPPVEAEAEHETHMDKRDSTSGSSVNEKTTPTPVAAPAHT